MHRESNIWGHIERTQMVIGDDDNITLTHRDIKACQNLLCDMCHWEAECSSMGSENPTSVYLERCLSGPLTLLHMFPGECCPQWVWVWPIKKIWGGRNGLWYMPDLLIWGEMKMSFLNTDCAFQMQRWSLLCRVLILSFSPANDMGGGILPIEYADLQIIK